jgi:hypothetical protein
LLYLFTCALLLLALHVLYLCFTPLLRFTAVLLPLYCCFYSYLIRALLVLYSYFTQVLLLLYSCFTLAVLRHYSGFTRVTGFIGFTTERDERLGSVLLAVEGSYVERR